MAALNILELHTTTTEIKIEDKYFNTMVQIKTILVTFTDKYVKKVKLYRNVKKGQFWKRKENTDKKAIWLTHRKD